MEVEDFYTGEKKDIEIPDGCIIIDKDSTEAELFFGSGDFVFWNLFADNILVDFFPNNPQSIDDIPLFKSEKEGFFKVIVIEDKYKEWFKLKQRQRQNEIKRQQNIAKQQSIFDKKGHLRQEGDQYRKSSKNQQAIDSYNSALQVEYKTVNKWFKLYCIDEDLQSLDGLIAIYHKLNDFEKERECIERAISLASLNSRHEKHLLNYKHRLEKLLGTYIEKEVPPESHMNVVYSDLTNYMEILNKMYHPIVIKKGCVVTNKEEQAMMFKSRKYFDNLFFQGKKADKSYDYKTAADYYERIVAEGWYYDSFPYDRLMQLYFNYKMYDDEVRIINLAIKTFQQHNVELLNGYKNPRFHDFDNRIEKWEKRLVAAQKRLQSSQKKNIS